MIVIKINKFRMNGVWTKAEADLIVQDSTPASVISAMNSMGYDAIEFQSGPVFNFKGQWETSVGDFPAWTKPVPMGDILPEEKEDPELDGKNILCAKLMDIWIADKGRQMPWNTAIKMIETIVSLTPEDKIMNDYPVTAFEQPVPVDQQQMELERQYRLQRSREKVEALGYNVDELENDNPYNQWMKEI